MDKIKEVIGRQIRQPSTWRGLGLLLSVLGVTVAPGAVEAIGAGFIAAIAIWETIRDQSRDE